MKRKTPPTNFTKPPTRLRAEMEDEVVIASSPTDTGISCWDLHSGAELLRYHSCASPPHGLRSVAGLFLASTQLPDASSSSGSVLFWSWNKPQAEVKCFLAEPINPLACTSDGTYIVGGGVSGAISLWEVATGRLLKRWFAHYRAVTCLVVTDDQSLLISGAEDGYVRVWSLKTIFDADREHEFYEYSFSDHEFPITDIITGYEGCNSIVVSASQDRTCKVWSLARGTLLRNIVFPSIIDAIALAPGDVFYAGGRDGRIYIARLDAQGTMGSLSHDSKAITSLAFALNGYQLVSGSEDGMVRVWDTRTRNFIREFRLAKGPVNNILVFRQSLAMYPRTGMNSQSSSVGRHVSPLPPPLEKHTYVDEELDLQYPHKLQNLLALGFLEIEASNVLKNEYAPCLVGTSSPPTFEVPCKLDDLLQTNDCSQLVKACVALIAITDGVTFKARPKIKENHCSRLVTLFRHRMPEVRRLAIKALCNIINLEERSSRLLLEVLNGVELFLLVAKETGLLEKAMTTLEEAGGSNLVTQLESHWDEATRQLAKKIKATYL